MPLKRMLQEFLVLAYLTVTLAAFLYTLTRVQVPFIPSPLLSFSHVMMAPYQGDVSWNDDVVAEGEGADGHWEEIDLAPYFPYGFAEANIRKLFPNTLAQSVAIRSPVYRAFGTQLLEREQEQGRSYRAVRFFQLQWPRSPIGFRGLQLPPFTTRTFLAEAP